MHSSSVLKKLTGVFLFLCFILSLLSGCAGKRWKEPLAEEESAEIISRINVLQETYKSCPESLDADASIFWKSPSTDFGMIGYLQLSSPSYIKYILTNPLGMMIYAFASDGKTFQILDTFKYRHTRGNVRSLVIRHKLPLLLAEGDWFNYLSGRLPSDPIKIQQVTRDVSDQTVWVLLARSQFSITDDQRWVHIDLQQQTILGYLFLDASGKTLAEISYEKQEGNGDNCKPKEKIMITGLPWGSEMRIELQDISTATQFNQSDFTLPVPETYSTQLQP
ncbi:MAG: hypothetical protein JKY62_02475 [Desulfocapsa sp.]|nr:hypothetical protein [Desulfocapsa sp.]